jgi:uncharacterized protein YgiM (DUF1202 family)
MFLSRVTATLRYLTSIGLGFAAIALSVMFLFEAPASVRSDAPPTVATIKSAARASSLPQLKAADFDVARAVPVVVTGKAEPVTVAAPVDAKAKISANLDALGKLPAQGQAIVSADAVNVRAKPSKGSTKLFVVRSGQVVDVLESEGGWSRIAGQDGASGWVATKFLQR